MRAAAAVLALVAAATPLAAQQKRAAHDKVSQARVDEAIRKGVAYLKTAGSIPSHQEDSRKIGNSDELLLWTFIYAGVPEDDKQFQEMFARMMESKLERTYKVALQAMVLEELDRAAYQWRIAQCGQFLADNQGKNGQWDYGAPTMAVDSMPTGGKARKEVSSGGKPDEKRRKKPPIRRTIPIKKTRDGPATGDFSNSQYAALGMRACHDAGVIFPTNVIDSAADVWKSALHADTGAAAKGQGWCYCVNQHKSYGSMTAGGIGTLAIFDYMRGRDWRKNREIAKAFDWLTTNFSVTHNPGPYEHVPDKGENTALHYYYYLYAMERAGVLYGTETIGPHEWYPEGAAVLLAAQKPDGAWDAETGGNGTIFNRVWDTCFAILFLRRATQPLIDTATGGRR